MRESVAIADACFDRLLEIARTGITEREIGAAMYERCYALGGEDPLFLEHVPRVRRAAARRGASGRPVDRVLERGEQLVFSFELDRAAWATGWSSRAWSCSASRPSCSSG